MEKIKKVLKASGCIMTVPREAVLKVLFSLRQPISARDLHKKIRTVDQASVYRALNLFEDLHLLNVEIVEKEKLYCLADVPHHHIICERCGYTEEVKCNHNFGRFKNFSNVYHRLTLTGICNKCN